MAAHDHDHNEGSNLSEMELRVRALETILVDKGYIESAALDRIVELYETKIGPHIGAQVIAKAWSDPAFRQALLEDASKAVNAFAQVGGVGEHLIAVENTPQVHNMVVCTLCSCYPTDVLGLPPAWYKSFAYRSRAVKDPRAVLADFGVSASQRDRDPSLGFDGGDPLPGRADASGRNRGLERSAACQIDHARQHDRRRPAEKTKRGGLMDGVHDMGGMDGFGKVEPEPNEPVFHHRWEGRVLAMSRAIGVFRAWTIDTSRYAIELMAPSMYLTRPYYEKWFLRNQNLLIERGLIDADEVAAGRALRPAKKHELVARSHWPTWRRSPNVVRTAGRRPRRRGSKSATGCARKTFTQQRIRACRVTRAVTWEWWSACMARTFFPTPRLPAKGTIRSGFIPCVSMPRRFGAPTRTQS